ncbi:hypothetical protein CTAYLR_000656 [Chrysophaeum taylorii]|uniref:DUF4116 domain-containing protein n=1 Tax=Chrysophaeum taylorii TaxID=2483200 RepID=A0AAD7U8S7_9STRA|nr:hypothetical protein CTAYLR_000656 [Chrysophaeum taylorii]
MADENLTASLAKLELVEDKEAKKEAALAAVRKNGRALEELGWEFRRDSDVVLAAVEQDAQVLPCVPPQLRKRKEIVLAAVRQKRWTCWVLAEVVPHLAGDKDVVIAGVEAYPRALDVAASRLKKDKEVVLAAVREDGRALQFAATELRRDKEIVLAAVRQHGRALRMTRTFLPPPPPLVRRKTKRAPSWKTTKTLFGDPSPTNSPPEQ